MVQFIRSVATATRRQTPFMTFAFASLGAGAYVVALMIQVTQH